MTLSDGVPGELRPPAPPHIHREHRHGREGEESGEDEHEVWATSHYVLEY